jgi:3-hydroxyisobutyrate dehydrogenase-like beta-hydroxyacid dehydrogenase
MAERIGFIGLGNMGRPMAERLLARGAQLVVCDVRPEAAAPFRGRAEVVDLPAEVGRLAPIVFASLPTPQAVRTVVLGAGGLAEAEGLDVYVDLSTSGSQTVQAVAQALAARGVGMLDAPVSGGVAGAEGGTLAVMVAGAPALVERVRPYLEAFGRIFVVGEKPGQAQVVKLANNLLSGAALALTSEVMVMGVKAGLDPARMLDAINAGTGRNSATADKFPRQVLPRRFQAGFKTALMYKDLSLCLAEAEAAGVPMWVGSAVHQFWRYVMARGGGEEDFSAVVRYVEEWAGVEVKAGDGTGARA